MKYIIECFDGSIYYNEDGYKGFDEGALKSKSNDVVTKGFLICENGGEHVSVFKNNIKTIKLEK